VQIISANRRREKDLDNHLCDERPVPSLGTNEDEDEAEAEGSRLLRTRALWIDLDRSWREFEPGATSDATTATGTGNNVQWEQTPSILSHEVAGHYSAQQYSYSICPFAYHFQWCSRCGWKSAMLIAKLLFPCLAPATKITLHVDQQEY
jgi:hypothetical protein